MGIGNPGEPGVGETPRDRRSLPLMGIGNASYTILVKPGRSTSLPLMGIGNRLAAADARAAGLALITPHGDRKLDAGAWSQPADSLPLMGIGNHWYAAMRYTVFEVYSLPLMRIGNEEVAEAELRRVAIALITPHGDRKLLRVADVVCLGPAPHYPSWGSETRRRRAALAGLPAHRRLITPHGDRKPVCHAHGAAPATILITPHGDRKPPPRAEDLSAGHPHYPSWGSETRRRHRAGHGRRHPHYPSWGSETSR